MLWRKTRDRGDDTHEWSDHRPHQSPAVRVHLVEIASEGRKAREFLRPDERAVAKPAVSCDRLGDRHLSQIRSLGPHEHTSELLRTRTAGPGQRREHEELALERRPQKRTFVHDRPRHLTQRIRGDTILEMVADVSQRPLLGRLVRVVQREPESQIDEQQRPIQPLNRTHRLDQVGIRVEQVADLDHQAPALVPKVQASGAVLAHCHPLTGRCEREVMKIERVLSGHQTQPKRSGRAIGNELNGTVTRE